MRGIVAVMEQTKVSAWFFSSPQLRLPHLWHVMSSQRMLEKLFCKFPLQNWDDFPIILTFFCKSLACKSEQKCIYIWASSERQSKFNSCSLLSTFFTGGEELLYGGQKLFQGSVSFFSGNNNFNPLGCLWKTPSWRTLVMYHSNCRSQAFARNISFKQSVFIGIWSPPLLDQLPQHAAGNQRQDHPGAGEDHRPDEEGGGEGPDWEWNPQEGSRGDHPDRDPFLEGGEPKPQGENKLWISTHDCDWCFECDCCLVIKDARLEGIILFAILAKKWTTINFHQPIPGYRTSLKALVRLLVRIVFILHTSKFGSHRLTILTFSVQTYVDVEVKTSSKGRQYLAATVTNPKVHDRVTHTCSTPRQNGFSMSGQCHVFGILKFSLRFTSGDMVHSSLSPRQMFQCSLSTHSHRYSKWTVTRKKCWRC